MRTEPEVILTTSVILKNNSVPITETQIKELEMLAHEARILILEGLDDKTKTDVLNEVKERMVYKCEG